MKNNSIAILGEGITAKSVSAFCKTHAIDIVSPEEADLVIASPGIPPKEYPRVKAEIISDIEWAYRLFQESAHPPKLIAVTGTNGKSTVTAMIAHILDAPYAGNIGIPLINYVGLEQEFPCIVVEVSSYQLESCVRFKPDISILLNITEDHMTRHGSMEEYSKQKAKVCMNQDEKDLFIYNSDDELVCELLNGCKARKIGFSMTSIEPRIRQLPLVGEHNFCNAWVAVLAGQDCEQSIETSLSFLKSFKGLKHRLELVTEHKGRLFYNDSKATNPDSTLIALRAFSKPVHLILCGEDKQLELTDFMKEVQKKALTVTAFGTVADKICSISRVINPDYALYQVSNLEEAIQNTMRVAKEGSVILFSPSSSSFDMFNGFENRGDMFIETVAELTDEILV
jgi:UDP-N-acetylmuramoylalanine--D-glutamate ligase